MDALEGEPGVYSARYAGKNATTEQRNQKLLAEMEEVPSERIEPLVTIASWHWLNMKMIPFRLFVMAFGKDLF